MTNNRHNIVFQPIIYHHIGIVHTPFLRQQGTPIQPIAGKDVRGTVEVFPEYADGLKDIDGFSHLLLLFHMHLAKGFSLRTRPYLDDVERGVFAIRGPRRPNPIGLSIVRLEKVEENILHIRDLDMIDGTPLLDIKPYLPNVDERDGVRIGWLKGKKERFEKAKADGRFSD